MTSTRHRLAKRSADETYAPKREGAGERAESSASDAKKVPANMLPIYQKEDESVEEAIAHAILRPQTKAAFTVYAFAGGVLGQPSLAALMDDLVQQGKCANNGDLGRAAEILVAQAHTLDSIFHNLAQRCSRQLGDGYLEAGDTYMRLALRAQGQCRATLEALAAIKNPSIIFAKQANIAHGHQQVNNDLAHEKTEIPPSELLEHEDGKRLDTRTTCGPGEGNPPLAALEAIHRPAHGRRKVRRKS